MTYTPSPFKLPLYEPVSILPGVPCQNSRRQPERQFFEGLLFEGLLKEHEGSLVRTSFRVNESGLRAGKACEKPHGLLI